MATNITPFPRLPTPPQELNTGYVVDLVRALEIFLKQAQNPQLNFQEIKETGTAGILSVGDMYIADGGFLKIVQEDDIFVNTNVATTALGSVTVSIS